jgi:branched-chain amino acid transport system ATP-binding protein
VLGLKPHEITARGIARTFQNVRLFGSMSVLDNVCVAGQLRTHQGVVGTLLRTAKRGIAERSVEQQAFALLGRFGLQERALERAGGLSFGHQRQLEIARAVATRPQVLLLDEPAAGLNPQEKRELGRTIRDLRDRFGLSILLIEHDMALVMEICERIVVLDHGVTIAEGAPDAIQNDPRVIAAYLGE